MSYEEALLNDFGSDDEDKADLSLQEAIEDQIHDKNDIIDNNKDAEADCGSKAGDDERELQKLISNPLQHQQHLNQLDSHESYNPTQYLRIPRLTPLIESKLQSFDDEQESDFLQLISYSDFENDEYKFLLQINQIITLINYEKEFLLRFITVKYNQVFPELATIVMNPFDYIKVVQLIKQDLKNIKNYEQDLRQLLPNDKLLVVMMSGVKYAQDSQHSSSSGINEDEFNTILRCCQIVGELETLLTKLSTFIQGKLLKFTPNLSNLLGSITTAQLLINTGSLNQLCLIPSCNLPSLGVKELSTQMSSTGHAKTIPKGYLYQNDMIKYLPPNIVKLALRILSGKVILAARIDLSKTTPSGEMGLKYRQEVMDKIDKLLIPPESTMVKPLPKPTEFKSKRRGGRKLQKAKAKFRSSELAKAQDKMAFANQEDSYVNSFGEEVGLGMVKDSRHLAANPNTSATVSKSMKSRLETPKTSNHLESALNEDFESIFKKSNSKEKAAQSSSKWITTDMKK